MIILYNRIPYIHLVLHKPMSHSKVALFDFPYVVGEELPFFEV